MGFFDNKEKEIIARIEKLEGTSKRIQDSTITIQAQLQQLATQSQVQTLTAQLVEVKKTAPRI